MAIVKHRRFSAFSPKIALLIFLGFFLIAVWVFSGRSRVPQSLSSDVTSRYATPEVDIGNKKEDGSSNKKLEDDDDTKTDGINLEEESDQEIKDDGKPDGINLEEEGIENDQEIKDDGKLDGINFEEEHERISDEQENKDDSKPDEENIEEEQQKVEHEQHDSEWKDLDRVSIRKDGKVHAEESPSQGIPWKLCTGKGASDYIPCLDNEEAIKMLPSRKHYEHRERHCPTHEDLVTCLVPLPKNYKKPIPWPQSRDEVWYDNVPHPGLVTYKKDQSWVKKSGNRLVFPGSGTQFVLGANHYIDFIEQTLPDIAWGKHTRVILDVGCGVASFGGYLFQKDMLTMSFAPKDEHEAQVQLALERGIPAISAVMGSQRLVFPANVFDMVHCARCRVPWHEDGGMLLLEVNRVLRPGGYFLWSSPPVYRTQADQVKIWKETSSLAASMCWNQLARKTDAASGVGVAIFQKPQNNFCYEHRRTKSPPPCDKDDNRDAAWYVPMKSCIHKVPVNEEEHGNTWPKEWPLRLQTPPAWLKHVPKGLYGKPGLEEFKSDTEHWNHVIQRSYLRGLGLDWKNIRNVMDMKAAYGGFAAALSSQPVWVMNVVPIHEPDTLPVIFDRGLFGIYHDWCESLSTYPRTYDLIHADHLLTGLTKRCNVTITVVEIDRILRPEAYAIFRDKVDNLSQLKPLMESLRWKIHLSYTQGREELLVIQKQWWRPKS